MWVIILPLVVWLILYYTHTQLRSSSTASTPTRHDSSHFSMSWYGTATYSTSALNQLLYRAAQRHQRLLHYIYLPAIPVALLALPLSVALLLFNILHIVYVHVLVPLVTSISASDALHDASAAQLSDTNLLSIAVPGVTLPLSSVGYLWLAVLVSVVLHEAGHALCACAEGVRVRSVGLMWLVMFPAAYVETEELEDDEDEQDSDDGSEDEVERMDEDSIHSQTTTRTSSVTAVQQLKIVSSGIYHNLLLTIVTLALLAALPTLLSFAHHTSDSGVTVLSVDGRVSPALAASNVLVCGSRIVGVNQWPVGGVSEWQNVLVHRAQQQRAPVHDGWCVSAAMVADTAKVQRRQMSKWTTAKADDSWQQLARHVTATLRAERLTPSPPSSSPLDEATPRAAPMPAALRQAGMMMEHSDRPLVPANNARYDSDMLAFSCCLPELDYLSPLVCFTHNLTATIIPTPSLSSSLVCLQPKGLITTTTTPCSATTACLSSTVEPLICISPQLSGGATLLVLLVEAADGGSRDEVRFVGRVDEVLAAVECTGYAPRTWLRFMLIILPFLTPLALRWPVLCTRLLQFIVAVSTSLLMLNALPIPYADGEHFVRLLGVAARDKRRVLSWHDRWLQRVLCVFPDWWWEERQLEWRIRMVTVLFAVNVAMSMLPIVATAVQSRFFKQT